jgi:hypothetical protein
MDNLANILHGLALPLDTRLGSSSCGAAVEDGASSPAQEDLVHAPAVEGPLEGLYLIPSLHEQASPRRRREDMPIQILVRI